MEPKSLACDEQLPDWLLLHDGNAGVDILIQNFGGQGAVDGGSFWEWDGGSSLFFW